MTINYFHYLYAISDELNARIDIGRNIENIMADPDRNIENVGAALVAAHGNGNKTISDIVGAFKSITTVKYIQGVKTLDWAHFEDRLWQHNYWEHIIRKQESYQQIADYIMTNPAKWKADKLNQ